MLATNGPRWFDRTPDPRWPSVGVSLVVTAALFASAFVAMQTFTPLRSALDSRLEKPVVVRLSPPRVTPPPEIVTPRTSRAAPLVSAPRTATVDSAASRGTSAAAASGAGATTHTFAGGAPIARSGFVRPVKPLTPEAR